MFKRLWAVILKETREFVRDPLYVSLVVIGPILMLIMFGYGMDMDVERLHMVAVDHDNSEYSRELLQKFQHDDVFVLQEVINSVAKAEQMLQAAEARFALVIPPDFGRKISRGEHAELEALAEATYTTQAQTALGYAEAIAQQYLDQIWRRRGGAGNEAESSGESWLRGLPFSIGLQHNVWFNPDLESKNYLIPGLYAIVLTYFPAVIASFMFVRERETGTDLNYLASTARPWEIVLGKAIPYGLVVSLAQFVLAAIALGLFQVRFQGSLLLLFMVGTFYIFCTIGLGLFISVLCRTQISALIITVIAVLMPSFMYSGLYGPVAPDEPLALAISHLVPAYYFVTICRGIFLKGLGLTYYAFEITALFVLTLFIYGITISAFRKRRKK